MGDATSGKCPNGVGRSQLLRFSSGHPEKAGSAKMHPPGKFSRRGSLKIRKGPPSTTCTRKMAFPGCGEKSARSPAEYDARIW